MTNPTMAAPDARILLEQARQAASAGDYEQAAGLFSMGVGNPDPIVHVAALLGLADARYRLDDEEGALQSWIVATQAPETPLAWQAWVALAGARVRQGDLVGAARAYREAEPRAPLEERPGIQSRLGWLNKEMGNTGTAQRYFGRARASAFTPLMTYAIIAVTVAISLVADFTQAGAALGDLLFLDKQAVAEGEYWRLLTVTLLHGGPLHLLFNMYALWIVGPLAESLYGRATFLGIYLLSALGGSIASYLVFPNPSVGASGAVFGLFGLIFTATYFHKPALGRAAAGLTRQIGMLIVINLVIGLGIAGFAAIDNAAHIGGLLVGAWLGFIIAPRGATTLAAFWSRPKGDGSGGAPTRTAADRLSPLIRLTGVIALAVVLVIALNITPLWA
ncbi:MAG TPA: rhomboid family intramembrane serine protease [Candidatus Limnocylindrales bacterium]|nr:rhomboid family intramembrane serine protease [Candidatus Limnocylindrales bacterium]